MRPTIHDAANAATKPPATAAILPIATGLSRLGNGFVETFGPPLGWPAPAGSGSWITTACSGFGIVIGFLHFGQGPVRPAYWSLTVNRDVQLVQTTTIGMGAWEAGKGSLERADEKGGRPPDRPEVSAWKAVASSRQTASYTCSMSEDPTNIVRRPKTSGRPDGSRRSAAGVIRFSCPNGHQIVVDAKLAGKRGSCSRCGAAVVIPTESPAAAPERQGVAETAEPDFPSVEPVSPPEPQPVADSVGVPTVAAAPEAGPDEVPDFSGIGTEAAVAEDGGPSDEVGPFDGIPSSSAATEQSFAGVDASEEPDIDGIDNPTAVLVLKLFSECADDSTVELHLKSGQIVMPMLFDFKWSRGTHGVFATPNKADDSVTLVAVAWDSVEQVIVRKVPGLPEGMFE